MCKHRESCSGYDVWSTDWRLWSMANPAGVWLIVLLHNLRTEKSQRANILFSLHQIIDFHGNSVFVCVCPFWLYLLLWLMREKTSRPKHTHTHTLTNWLHESDRLISHFSTTKPQPWRLSPGGPSMASHSRRLPRCWSASVSPSPWRPSWRRKSHRTPAPRRNTNKEDLNQCLF